MSQKPSTNPQARTGMRKVRVGRVTSAAMDKTAVVEVVGRVPHPRFGKIVKKSKRFHVHDENNETKVGDVVQIIETRPLSKLKRWRLVEIQSHDPEVAAESHETTATTPDATTATTATTTPDAATTPDATTAATPPDATASSPDDTAAGSGETPAATDAADDAPADARDTPR